MAKTCDCLTEIRIHGRGGQGIQKSAQILGRAANLAGFNSQDFAIFGAERQGAPVMSFVRICSNPIKMAGYIFEPDYVLILDESIGLTQALKGVKKITKILIDSGKAQKKKNYYSINATGIAMEIIGRPIANTTLLGAFVKLFPFIEFEHLEKAIEIELKKYGKTVVEKNVLAARKAFNELKA